MDRILSKKYLHIYILSTIFIIGIFFRFYNTPSRYGLDYDATRDALIAIQGAKDLQLPLTGADSSVGPFHFGPWYYYFLILFRIFIYWDYAPWLYVSVASFLCIPIFYKIGKLLENKYFGLLLAGLVAISPSQIGPSVGLSNPHLVPFYVSLTLLLFIKIIKNTSVPGWLSFFFGMTIGVGINHHYQMSILLVLPFFIILSRKEKRLFLSFAVLSGLGISFVPLLFFEITNHWANLHGLFYYTFKMEHPYIPNSWSIYIRDFIFPFWSYTIGLSLFCGVIFSICSTAFSLWMLIRSKLQKSYAFLFASFIISFLFLRYYPGDRLYYQNLFIQPFIFLLTGFFVWNLIMSKSILKYVGAISAFLLFVYPIPDDLNRLRPIESYTIFKKQEEIITQNFPGKVFRIYRCGKRDRNKPQAIALLLHQENKLQANGLKIGILGDDCKTGHIIKKKISYLQVKKTDMINILENSESLILRVGLEEVSPETIYSANTRWWFKEQP